MYDIGRSEEIADHDLFQKIRSYIGVHYNNNNDGQPIQKLLNEPLYTRSWVAAGGRRKNNLIGCIYLNVVVVIMFWGGELQVIFWVNIERAPHSPHIGLWFF